MMIHTNPNENSMFSEDAFPSKGKHELYSYELISCPTHPGFGVEIFCAKDNFQPALLCIKCILDPQVSKETRGGNMIAIRDVITKSVEKTQLIASMQSNLLPSENLEQQYLEFEKKDYIRSLERHAERQMKKLDQDIEKVKESLQKLRQQFAVFFGRQIQTLTKKDEEIKKHMAAYIQEKDELNKVSFLSVGELLKELSKLNNFRDYEKFVKLLYKRSNHPKESGEDYLQKIIFDLMDRMKSQAHSMKGTMVDTRILEELRERIDAINILDDTPAEIPSLDPKLETLLEKIRKTEKKTSSPFLESLTPKHSPYAQAKHHNISNKSSPLDGKHTQKSSLLEVLKQKFGLDKSDQSKTNNTSSSEKKFERENLFDKMGSWKDFGTKGTTNMMVEENANRRASNSWFESKAQHPVNQEIESEVSDNGNVKPSFQLQSNGREQSRLSKHLASSQEKAVPESNNQDALDTSPRYRLSYSTESKRQRDKSPADVNPEGAHGSEHGSQRKKSHSNLEMEEEDNFAEQEEHHEAAPSSEYKKSSPVEGSTEYMMSQWVDEKLNGFTVYQNTVRDEHQQLTEEAFNKVTSQQWFQMARSERDEYTEVAIAARPGIKDELKLYDTTELNELRELANEKIKQVKKQK